MVSVGIIGLGSYLPQSIISNNDLKNSGVDTTDEWIVQRTGIKTRRMSNEKESLPIMMSIAASRALKDAGLSPSDLDYIIAGTNSTDPILVPQLASRVQFLIGANNIPAFDVQAGCTGAIYATEVAVRTIRDIYQNEFEGPLKRPKRARILVLGGDTLSNVIEVKNRNSSVILSDGAGAAILEPTFDDEEGIQHIFNKADGSQGHLIHYESGFHNLSLNPLENNFSMPGPFLMNGRNVHKFILTISSEVIKNIIEKAGLPLETLARSTIIPHQMNLRSIESFVEGLREDFGFKLKYIYTNGIINYGNNSTASTLIGLDETYREQKLDLHDPVIVVAFGAGITWGGYLTMWNKPKPEMPIRYGLNEEKNLLEEYNGKYNSWKSKLAK